MVPIYAGSFRKGSGERTFRLQTADQIGSRFSNVVFHDVIEFSMIISPANMIARFPLGISSTIEVWVEGVIVHVSFISRPAYVLVTVTYIDAPRKL